MDVVAEGIDVVAEGIEDSKTVAAHEGMSQIIGQGWHFGRPMTGDAILTWWREHTG